MDHLGFSARITLFVSDPHHSHAAQFERNRRSLAELCAAIERASPALPPNLNSQTLPLSNAKARILLIDDSKFARGIARGFLEAAGHSVVESADGHQGIERYALDRYDIVITDIVMEGMGGLDVLDKILALDPK